MVVDFARPASWFPAAAASPTLAIVPSTLPDGRRGTRPARGPGGVRRLSCRPPRTTTGFLLTANPRYWAGKPAIDRIRQVTSLDGGSVDAFQAGDVDFVNISPDDASWIRYDRTLGPQLRRADDLAVDYFGFDTTRAALR